MTFYFVIPSLSLVRFRLPIMLLRYSDKRIVNIMKVYIERNNLKLELIRYRNFFDFIHVYFYEATDSMQCHTPNGYQVVSNTNHFGSVSDSLGRLSAMSLCMASSYNISTGNLNALKHGVRKHIFTCPNVMALLD